MTRQLIGAIVQSFVFAITAALATYHLALGHAGMGSLCVGSAAFCMLLPLLTPRGGFDV